MKGKKKKMQDKKEGYVLILLLVFMVFLLVGAGIVAYANYRNLQTFKATENSIKALRIAQSGLEKAAVILSNDTSKCNDTNVFPLQENFAGGNYTVTCNSISKELKSCGYFRQAVRCVVASFNSTGGDFVPFMVRDTFKLDNFIRGGGYGHGQGQGQGQGFSVNFTEATLWATYTEGNGIADMENANFTIEDLPPDTYIPKVEDAKIDSLFPDKTECADGSSYSQDLTSSDISRIISSCGNTTCIICGRNIAIDSQISFTGENQIIFAASGNFVVSTTGGSAFLPVAPHKLSTLVILANDTFKSNVPLVDHNNGNNGNNGAGNPSPGPPITNLLLYAKNEINVNSDAFIKIGGGGNHSSEELSNAIILTEGKIVYNNGSFLTTRGHKLDNILVWADKGIYSNGTFFDIRGGGNRTNSPVLVERNFSVLVAEGNATFENWRFHKNAIPSGLTKDEISDLCEDENLPSFIREVYCKLENLIQNGGSRGKIKFSKIRIY